MRRIGWRLRSGKSPGANGADISSRPNAGTRAKRRHSAKLTMIASCLCARDDRGPALQRIVTDG